MVTVVVILLLIIITILSLLWSLLRAEQRATEAREEVEFWHRDALARLQMATWLHKGVMAKGDEDRAAKIRVSTMMPTLAAIKSARTRDFYENCPICGGPIKLGDLVAHASIHNEEDDNDMVCARHVDGPGYVYAEDDADKIIAAAEKELEGPDDPIEDEDELTAPLTIR